MSSPAPRPRRTAGQALLTSALALGALLAAPPAAAQTTTAPASATEPLVLDLPAQPLGAALAALSRQAGVPITADASVLAGRTTRALRGRYPLREALGQLLTGSGLVAVVQSDGGIVLRERTGTDAGGVARLGEVAVRATAANRAVTLDAATLGPLGTRGVTETPYSVTVLGQGLFRAQQAAHLGDFIKNDASTVVGNVPVGFVSLRGFVSGTDGFLYDGLAGYNGLTDARGGIEAFDRVEVLKGPSAFLFGAGGTGALGGTINYVPKRAPAQPVRDVEVNYAGRSLFGAAVDVGDRVGAERQFGYRVNAAYKDGDQATEDYRWQHAVGSVSLDWRPTPRLALAGTFDALANDLPRLQPFFLLAPGVPVPRPPDANRNIAQPWDDFRVRSTNVYLRAGWTLAPGWSLTAKGLSNVWARLGTYEARFGLIADTSGATTLFGSYDGTLRNRTNTGQATLQGQFRAGPTSHQLSLGGTGTREHDFRSVTDSASALFPTNIYAPVYAPGFTAGANTYGRGGRGTVGSVFVSDFVKLGDHWSALAGVRRGLVAFKNYDVATGALLPGDTRLWATTPTFALLYNPTSRVALYGNYADGIEQGGVAPQGTTNADQRLPAIRTRQTEAGAKYSAGGLTVTTAAFELSRPQEYVDAATKTYVQNARQRHRGLELSVTGDVTPSLTVVGGTMLLDARARRTGDATTEGRRPIGVPSLTGNLWARYRIPGTAAGGATAPGGLSLNAGVYYTGRQFLDPQNTQRIAAATRVDVGAEYDQRVGGRQIDYLLGVENVADHDYWTGGLSGLLILSNPRTVKATTRIHF